MPADHVLKIEVLQVDLAGTVRTWLGAESRARVITGGADWPRIQLRYSLQGAASKSPAARSGWPT